MNFDATHFFLQFFFSSGQNKHTHTRARARENTRRGKPHQLQSAADHSGDSTHVRIQTTDSCARSSPAADLTQYRSIRERISEILGIFSLEWHGPEDSRDAVAPTVREGRLLQRARG